MVEGRKEGTKGGGEEREERGAGEKKEGVREQTQEYPVRFKLTFHFLFAFFNSFQGCFIFIFFCLLAKETWELWRQACCRTD